MGGYGAGWNEQDVLCHRRCGQRDASRLQRHFRSWSATALAAADAAAGTETLYLGPGIYSAAHGFVDASGSNPISIVGDGESNTTLTTGTAGGQVLDFTDGEGTNADSQASISDLTVEMNDGGVGLDVPQHVTNVAITDSGPGTGTALGSQNTTVNNVTITMNESSPTVGIYRPNGTLTANGLTITANTGINGNGSNDSFTDLRIFANGYGIQLSAYNGTLGSSDSITDSEIVMTGASTAIDWVEGGGPLGTLDASFLTVVGDGATGSIGVESSEQSASQGNVDLSDSIVQGFSTSLKCVDSGGSAGGLSVAYSDFSPATESGSCAGSITSGGGNINANPDLIALADGDHPVAFDSPVIGAGNPSITGPLTDLLGNPRPGAGSTHVGMGAFEYQHVAPTAVATATPGSVEAGTPATFSADSSDPNPGDTLTYSWAFDDGTTASGPSVTHAFTTAGTHTATLTVTAPSGLASSAHAQVTVTAAPPTQPTPTTPTVASAGRASVRGTSATEHVSCAGANGATCDVTVSLSVSETLKGGKVVAVIAKAKSKTKKRTVSGRHGERHTRRRPGQDAQGEPQQRRSGPTEGPSHARGETHGDQRHDEAPQPDRHIQGSKEEEGLRLPAPPAASDLQALPLFAIAYKRSGRRFRGIATVKQHRMPGKPNAAQSKSPVLGDARSPVGVEPPLTCNRLDEESDMTTQSSDRDQWDRRDERHASRARCRSFHLRIPVDLRHDRG